MTAQVMDAVYLDGNEYTIICSTGEELIDPAAWEMPLDHFTTGCRRGYYCSFEIVDGCLYLRDLGVYSKDGLYPSLNGKEAEDSEDVFDLLRWYRDVRLPIGWSGVLALGEEDSYSKSYYIHMGSQALFSWKKVLGLELVDGRVVQIFPLNDLSEKYRLAFERANSDMERGFIRGLCTGGFGFMRDVFDYRREAVDRFYIPIFEREKKDCAVTFFTRQKLEEKDRPGAFLTIPYLPLGCSPLVIKAEHLTGIVNQLEMGGMVREDVNDVCHLMWLVYRRGFPHLRPECSMSDFEKIAALLEPEYDEEIDNTDDEEDKNRNTLCALPVERVNELRRLIEKAF